MSDNVNITPGSGAIVAADDVGGVMYQWFKLDLGGNGVAVPAPGDASNGLDVDVTRVGGHVSTLPKAGETWPVSAAAAIPVSDNAASLTVDAPVGTPVFVRLSDGSAPISGLPVSGEVDAVQGTAAANAGAWPIKISDGTDTVGITTESGAKLLKVDIVKSIANAATVADLAAIGQVTAFAGLYNDSATDPTAGQVAAVRITAERGLHVSPRNAAGVEIGSAASPFYIAAATVPGTFPVSGEVDVNLRDAAGAAFSTSSPVPVAITGKARTRVTKHAALTASQTGVAVWTPAASKKFYITGIILNVTVAGTLALFDVNNVLRWTSGTGLVGEMTIRGYEEL